MLYDLKISRLLQVVPGTYNDTIRIISNVCQVKNNIALIYN